jgi:hypothetical protein
MEDDLHVIFLMTPLSPFAVPWERFVELYFALPAPLARICDKIGADERFMLRARTRPPPPSGKYMYGLVCVCVCVCVCVYIGIPIHIYINIYIYLHTCIYRYTYPNIYI